MRKSNKIMMCALILGSLIYLLDFSAVVESNEDKGGVSKKEIKKIYVPEDYKTIKEALENAEEGDKIYIAAGRYEEPSGIRLKTDIGIYGAGADNTKIKVGESGILVVDGNEIKNFTFDLGGGQIYLNCIDNITLQNCIIRGNGASSGGITMVKTEKVSIINCTIVDFGNGINIRYSPCDILIKNCILSNNRVFGINVSHEEDKGIYFDRVRGIPTTPKKKGGGEIKVALEYNDVWGSKSRNYYGIDAGEHNISKDPKFVSENDYHLQPGSPCIGAGDPDSKYNNSDGTRNDIGALPYGAKNK